jgi:hypothetical protein
MPPLSMTTNILRHPKLPIGTPNKAAPTVQVSFSNANAQRGLAASTKPALSSCIPFPSQPIICTRISPSHTEQSFDSEAWLQVASDTSYSGSTHVVNSTYLSGADYDLFSTFVHRSTHIYSQADPFCMDLETSNHVAWPTPSVPAAPRKRKMAVKRVKTSTSSTKGTKRTKRDRSSKHNAADMAFAATLHRSILAHLQTLSVGPERALTRKSDVFSDSAASLLYVQDHILVERLRKSLVKQGISPAHINSAVGDAEQFTLRPARLGHVFQTQPISLGIIDERGMDVDCMPIDVTELQTTAPFPAPPHSSMANEDILTLPQLVALLILRHRHRSFTRHRSQGSCRDRKRPGKSPLSKSTKVSTLRGPK